MRIVGKAVPVMEARDKVTGRTEFVDDIRAELFVKILGSPHAHAEIKSIDTSRAEKLEGVKAILTYREVPRKLIPFSCHRPCFVMDKHLRYVGDYVAAVAATSEAIAEEALELIDVEYEVLPGVFDPEEAVRPTAPKLFPEGNNFAHAKDMPPVSAPLVSGNECGLQEWGDINRGFEEADTVIEDSFDIAPQVHSALEPHVCMANWSGDELTIRSSTQTPWELCELVAHTLQMPQSKVVVLSANVGGSFGSKYTGRYQFIPCLLSRMAGGKSTKLTFTREEAQCYARRPRGKVYAKMGAKKDGTITALHFRGYFDIGAYGNFRGGSLGFHFEGGTLSYSVENARFEGYDIHTNHFRSDSMRGVHVPFVAFAVESVVDEMAERLGLDPVEMRLKNMPDSGDLMPPTEYTNNYGMFQQARLDIYPGKKLLQQVVDSIEWKKKWKGFGKPAAVDGPKRRGIGLAYVMGYGGYNHDGGASMQVVINPDGSAIIHSGTQEIGQGINTALRMLAAESLGMSLEDVSIVTGDTRTGQFDFTNARSSHQLATNGHLLLEAIEEAKEKIRVMLAPWLEGEPKDIELSGRKARVRGRPESEVALEDVLGLFGTSVTGSATGPLGSFHPEVKPGFKAKQPIVLAIEVEVDIETGDVKPLGVISGIFPGRVINTGVMRGQTLGGTAQTLGWALWEELRYDEKYSAYLSRDFSGYRIPRALDVPEIETIFMEEVDDTSPPHEGLPYGGRGTGEMSAAVGPVAIASAIYNATGVRMRKVPMTAKTVLEALGQEAIR